MPSSRTSPAACAGSSRSSRRRGRCPATEASVPGRTRGRSRAATAARRRLSLGQPSSRRVSTSLHRRRRVLLGHQPAEVAALARQPGVLHEEERVAVGALPQRRRPGSGGRLWLTSVEDLGDRRGAAARSAPGVRRAAGPAPRRRRPARRSARGWSARWRGPAAAVGRRLGQQPEHPQRGDVGPVQVVEEHHREPVRGAASRTRGPAAPRSGTAAPSSSARAGRRQLGPEPAQHLLPRPQRRRAVVLRAAADQHPGAAARRPRAASSAPSRDLPMPGLAGQRRRRRAPPSACVEGADQRAELLRRGRPAARPAGGTTAGRAVGAGAAGGRGPARPRGRGRPGQLGVLAQQRGLQVAQLRRRAPAPARSSSTSRSRASTSSASAWRPLRWRATRPQRPEPLAQRVLRGQRLQLGGHRRVPAEGQLGGDPVLDRHQPQLLEPGALGDRRGRVPSSAYGIPRQAPTPRRGRDDPLELRAGERRRAPPRNSRIAAGTRPPSASKRPRIERVVGDLERVARGHGDQHGRRAPGGSGPAR